MVVGVVVDLYHRGYLVSVLVVLLVFLGVLPRKSDSLLFSLPVVNF